VYFRCVFLPVFSTFRHERGKPIEKVKENRTKCENRSEKPAVVSMKIALRRLYRRFFFRCVKYP